MAMHAIYFFTNLVVIFFPPCRSSNIFPVWPHWSPPVTHWRDITDETRVGKLVVVVNGHRLLLSRTPRVLLWCGDEDEELDGFNPRYSDDTFPNQVEFLSKIRGILPLTTSGCVKKFTTSLDTSANERGRERIIHDSSWKWRGKIESSERDFFAPLGPSEQRRLN